MTWQTLCPLDQIPAQGARVLAHPDGPIAVFRTHDDAVFALRDACPHKGGPLSQGIVHGEGRDARVSCPLHGWNFSLQAGQAIAPDQGSVPRYAVRVEQGMVWIDL